jgi:tungstate transport system substrate-binding protein
MANESRRRRCHPPGVTLPCAGRRLFYVVVACGLAACAASEPQQLILASTTSTEDSGLFDTLIPAFEQAEPDYRVSVIAVGSGEALELGRRGDADVLLVHAPAAESAFVADGYGAERADVMYNDFLIVGPAADPARVGGMSDAAEALRRIAADSAPFVSRGDDSGTHRKELALWRTAGVEPSSPWYIQAGLGMGDVLRIASERRGYTLTDRATFLFMQDGLDLVPLVEGDAALFNQYGVIPVAGARTPKGATAFMRWITSPAAQRRIARHGVERFGQSLFIPNAGVADTARVPR